MAAIEEKLTTAKHAALFSALRVFGSICAALLPVCVALLVWGSGVNERIAKNETRIASIEKEGERRDKLAERDRAEILQRLNEIANDVKALRR